MDPQEALRALGLMTSSPHRRDNEFYRLAGEWLRLRGLSSTDEKKYRVDLQKWHEDVVEYLVEMNLEAIEQGLISDPLTPILKQSKCRQEKGWKGTLGIIGNYLRLQKRS
jgi:hypothetical protein